MDSNRFNQILVVDSIPIGEYNTAKRLFTDLQTYAIAYSPSPAVHYVRVESADEFVQCVMKCRKDAEKYDIVPMLHIECHGDEDGFRFADGSLADWDELKVPITELNVATGLNLRRPDLVDFAMTSFFADADFLRHCAAPHFKYHAQIGAREQRLSLI